MNKKNVAIVAIGVGLFAFVAAKMGWSAMLDELKAVRIALPILAGLSCVRLWLQTMAWSAALEAYAGVGRVDGGARHPTCARGCVGRTLYIRAPLALDVTESRAVHRRRGASSARTTHDARTWSM